MNKQQIIGNQKNISEHHQRNRIKNSKSKTSSSKINQNEKQKKGNQNH